MLLAKRRPCLAIWVTCFRRDRNSSYSEIEIFWLALSGVSRKRGVMMVDERLIPAAFEGGAFHPMLPAGRASGEVSFGIESIRFHSEQGDFELSLDGLLIEAGGASDRLIFFKHGDHPQAIMHTVDRRVLDHPLLLQNAGLVRQRTRVVRKRRAVRMVASGVLSGLVFALVMLYVCRDSIVKTVARGVPVDLEIKMGETLFKQMMLSERLIVDEEISAQLEKITAPLVTGISDKRYPLKFHAVENATINAFAMPGGNVILHTGLLLAAETPEEVAGVLAHEIAHVQQRHGIRGILSSAGLFLIAQSLLGDVTGLVAVITDNGSFLLSRQFSRDFEREADEHGWDYLLAADIRPDGMIRFFQRMQEEERKMHDKVQEVTSVDVSEGALQLASTHPATQERIDALQRKWEKLPSDEKFRTFDLNFTDFQNRLRADLHTSAQEPEREE